MKPTTGFAFATLLASALLLPGRAFAQCTDYDTDGAVIGNRICARIGFNTLAPINVFTDGGSAVDLGVAVHNNAVLRVTGTAGARVGSNISLFSSSRAYFQDAQGGPGGRITDFIFPDALSEVEIRGLTIFIQVQSLGASRVTIHDCFTVGDAGSTVLAQGSSLVTIFGGNFARSVYALGSATIDMHGGLPRSSLPPGLVLDSIGAFESATINLYGIDLSSTLHDPNWRGGVTSLYAIAGMLEDGTSLDGKFYEVQNNGTAAVNLINPPVAVESITWGEIKSGYR